MLIFVIVSMDKHGTVEIETANDPVTADTRCKEVIRLNPDTRCNWYATKPGVKNERLHMPGK